MRGVAILLLFNFLGVALHAVGIPLPANVIGLIVFTACLFLGIIKLRWVSEGAEFLLRHMLLFFVPAIVSVVFFRGDIAAAWPAIVVGMVGSLLVVLIVTGLTANWLLEKRKAPDAGQ